MTPFKFLFLSISLSMLGPIAAVADNPHFAADSVRRVDVSTWQLQTLSYIVKGKAFKVSQHGGTSPALARAICTGIGFVSAGTAVSAPVDTTEPLNLAIFREDATVESVLEHEAAAGSDLRTLNNLNCSL